MVFLSFVLVFGVPTPKTKTNNYLPCCQRREAKVLISFISFVGVVTPTNEINTYSNATTASLFVLRSGSSGTNSASTKATSTIGMV